MVTVAVAFVCTPAARAQAPVSLLDVPYLPQSEALCGGAAAAMVMRYWNGPAIYADAFGHLVDRESGGIRGEDLVQSLRDLGWDAISFRGDASGVASHLARRRPVIALIEDRPNRFHYVVLVGWWNDRVIAHDPARAPFRIYDQDRFLQAWSRSGNWTLLATPPQGRPHTGVDRDATAVSPPSIPGAASAGRCEAMVNEGVRLARSGDLDGARELLDLAARLCATDSAPVRELAGVHAVREEWSSAARYAAQALAIDGTDVHAARILATSLFLQDDLNGALDAWNRIDEPVVDLVNVAGLERIRYEVAASLIRLQPLETLTAEKLDLARRRLSELPGVSVSRVSYVPGGRGRADVEAAIVERPMLPTGLVPLAALGVRALANREIVASAASFTGAGETLTVAWRWWHGRPRVAVSFETPSPSRRFGTVWRLDAFSERQSYFSEAEREETWRGAGFSVAEWVSGGLRVELGVGAASWDGLGTSGSIRGSLRRHSRDDRWMLTAASSLFSGGVRTGSLSAIAGWRSDPRAIGGDLHARAGFDVTGSSAPLSLWARAGTEPGQNALLRAHPLLDDGVVRRSVIGRTLLHGGAEWRYWIQPGARPFRLAPAVFVDAARASRTLPGFDRRLHVDAGIGLRVALAGAGTLRVDVGKGFRDGATALSIGWDR
jgi:hypothetical protein